MGVSLDGSWLKFRGCWANQKAVMDLNLYCRRGTEVPYLNLKIPTLNLGLRLRLGFIYVAVYSVHLFDSFFFFSDKRTHLA